jgi:general secretion pathway protein G
MIKSNWQISCPGCAALVGYRPDDVSGDPSQIQCPSCHGFIEVPRMAGDRSLPRQQTLLCYWLILILIILWSAWLYSSLQTPCEDESKPAKADLLTLVQAVREYELENGRIPTQSQGLGALMPRLKQLPVDPWGHPYQYRKPGVRDKGGFDLWSDGPDGMSETDDDIGNWNL